MNKNEWWLNLSGQEGTQKIDEMATKIEQMKWEEKHGYMDMVGWWALSFCYKVGATKHEFHTTQHFKIKIKIPQQQQY